MNVKSETNAVNEKKPEWPMIKIKIKNGHVRNFFLLNTTKYQTFMQQQK